MKPLNIYQKIIYCFLVFILGFFLHLAPAIANENSVEIYFFYSDTCPHCAEQKPLMEYIDQQNETVVLKAYEVNQNPYIWRDFIVQQKLTTTAVPRTQIGDRSFIGYSNTDGNLEYNPIYQGYVGYRNQIIQAIEAQLGQRINIPGRHVSQTIPWWILGVPAFYFCCHPILKRRLKTDQQKRYWIGGGIALILVSLFIFLAMIPEAMIKNMAQGLPFPVFVSILSLADGFNPCAFTVLLILLSLLTYTKSRRDMAIIGLTFVFTSAVMYFVFIILMIAVGSVFLETYGKITLLILGVLITIAGVVNLKDYLLSNQLISLSLSRKEKVLISQKAGKISRTLQLHQRNPKVFLAALGGTMVLAIFVNVIELGCTAILPVVYLTSLVQYCPANNSWFCFSAWTGLYSLVYIVPLLAILGNFIYSFKSARLTEDQGKVLKLVSGTLMIFFGIIMVVRPQLLLFG